ncbi:type II toxin-antitoxin system RelE/ParE family toxin [Taibaiella lutea]|uniref:Type II toxin-antitoxin system RelE/ParE family toxin n=1 Tax=Taibaiella lutea TaxID=2608001 RepID=A0A5M6CJR3_9BACT|nr:type II toxin-antitoxin system RelE/ParE family toxin [Taibaiella lutea]KAA5533595.1 type II toxin-antitoxin system RelE/ParE family toxin [Taibaiella lutea]
MVYEIVWTPKAIESFLENLKYLQQKWTQREVNQFASIVEEKILLLSTHPETGSPQKKCS